MATHLLWSLEGQRGTGRDSSVFSLFGEHKREKKMLHFDTELAYKHLVINIVIAVHKMDFDAMK